jgi:cytochrome c556
MKTIVLKELAILASGILLVSACGSPAPQQSAPPPAVVEQAAPTTAPTTAKPEVSINAVMVALVDHAAHQLWDVEVEGKDPKTDAAWLNVEEHAVQLVAAGPAITVGGTGPTDAVWVKSASWHTHAQGMSDAGVAAMNAAKSKNLMALRTANGQLLDTCLGCHKEFKPDAPTEGILHTHKD